MSEEDRPTQLLDPREAYARWAPTYPPHAHNPVMQAEERALLSLFPSDVRGCRVVDAGCGSGRYLLHALRRGARHLVGADFSPEMLERARSELAVTAATHGSGERAAQVDLIRASVESLPLRDRCADLTVCGLTIGHLPALEPALAELERITRMDGRILCSDFHPLAHERGWRREFSAGGQRYAVRHTPHYVDHWRRACAGLGLRITQLLEPSVDARDITPGIRFDPEALEVPVVIVLELSRVRPGGGGRRQAGG